MEYTYEILYHFTCPSCKGWWSYASEDSVMLMKSITGKGQGIYCMHCGHKSAPHIKEGFVLNNRQTQQPSPHSEKRDVKESIF